MQNHHLTRKQNEIYQFLLNNRDQFDHPPTLEELCSAMDLKSRGSLHKHVQALVSAGLVEAPQRKQRGIRLTEQTWIDNQIRADTPNTLPYVGTIAAGRPIEAIEDIRYMAVPQQLKTEKPCYILQVSGDSMIEAGIFDGDWVIVEQRRYARNGEIVVALIDRVEATLKYIEQYPHETLLIPANSAMEAMRYDPKRVEIQGALVGQMRSYIS